MFHSGTSVLDPNARDREVGHVAVRFGVCRRGVVGRRGWSGPDDLSGWANHHRAGPIVGADPITLSHCIRAAAKGAPPWLFERYEVSR